MLKDKYGKELSRDELMRKGTNRLTSIALDLELMFLRWVGCIPSHIIRGFIYRLCGVKIGKGSTIHMWCNFYNPAFVSIGEDTIIGDHAFLDGRARLSIGDHVALASSVMIYNAQHNIDDPS